MATVLASAAAAVLLAAAVAVAVRLMLRQRARRAGERRAQAAVARGHERYVLATAAAGVGVWEWHLHAKEIYLDPLLKRMLGYRDSEVPNEIDAWIALVHPADRVAARALMRACAGGSSETYSVERRMLHRNGSIRWFHSHASVVRDAAGKPARLVGVDRDVTDRARADAALRETAERMRAEQDRARAVVGRLIAAGEADRCRLARELEGDTSRHLALMITDIEQLAATDAWRVPDAAALLQNLAARAGSMAFGLHRLSRELYPPRLAATGLVCAVEMMCRDVGRQHMVAVEFRHLRVPRDLDEATALCLYRIVEEGLHNIVKHSGSVRATVDFAGETDRLRLRIADDGRGFDADRVPPDALGLVRMRERVHFLGGDIAIESAPALGTRIDVRLRIRPSRVIEMPRRVKVPPRVAHR
jgi:PAS domain S-box-containing protein